MSTASWWELLIMIPAATLGAYALIWSIPGVIFGAILSLGDPQRIVWIDKQLSKNVDKLHSNYQCMMSYNIMSRFVDYCIAYPFIRHRITSDSLKFKIFMWFNSLGFWCWIGLIILGLLAKTLGIIDF
ncbi:hypothetical protein KZN62_003578 [Vibrio cholerae]|nr:hypothetical protein [Vibrio cholerae]EHV9954602.1 hypothetical protein [Vibrio cholerae]